MDLISFSFVLLLDQHVSQYGVKYGIYKLQIHAKVVKMLK